MRLRPLSIALMLKQDCSGLRSPAIKANITPEQDWWKFEDGRGICMSTANKVLIHRWHEEVWNRKRPEAVFEMMHPDAIIFGLQARTAKPLRGPTEFLPFWERLINAFPDIHISVESTMAEDDKVMARCSVRGHHTGPGLGIDPSLKPIAITGICLAHVKDAQLYEAWNSFDFLGLYQQIGAINLPVVA